MSFKIIENRPLVRRKYNTERRLECSNMFKQLSQGKNLTGEIDLSLSNVRRYAKEQGYKISTSKIDNTHCYVWIKEVINE